MDSKINSFKIKYCIKYCFVLILLLELISCNKNYKAKTEVIEGNKAYEEEEFENAITHYKKALFQHSQDTTAAYNLGNGFYKIKQSDKALAYYKKADSLAKNNKTKAEIQYNTGNAYMNTKKYEQALSAYKESLRRNPDDEDTQYNYSVALEKIKHQDNKKKNKNTDNKKQDKQNKPSNSDKQGKQQEKENKEQQKDNNKNQEEQQNKNQQNSPQIKKEKAAISKEQINAALRALEDEEKDIQKRMIKTESRRQVKPKKTEKDW